ncbi:MAG: hypothetical protein LBV79_11645, partial [Candidatus Adiutrix sp.]|nr:hypothetical protein [Candidatus Adiutrix sp.]
MTVMRLSLLESDREPGDIRQGLSVGLLAVLVSIWVHLMCFSLWQVTDKKAADHFVFTLEAPQMEITLTITEEGLVAETPEAIPAPAAPAETSAAEAAPDGQNPLAALAEADLSPEDMAILEEL